MNLRPACVARVGLAAALMLVALVVSVAAGPFTNLVVFGDSLSDVGNIDSATFGVYPGPHYFSDRFSNGPVYVEALATGLGLPAIARSTAGGNNFAYGGARTSGTGGFEGLFIRDVDEQVDQFLASRTVDPDALFVVFAGSNDLVGGQTNVNIPVGNLIDDVGRLVAAGARQFLVPNLPLLGHTPRFNNNATTLAQFNALSAGFNAALDAALDNLSATNPSLTIFRLDVAGLFSEALADPLRFGLTNVADAAAPGLQPGASSYNSSQIAPNAHEYLFWDDLHPTATVHAHLAQAALELLLPLEGDFNGDDVVDAADYVAWRDGLGSTHSLAEYDLWRAHFGQTSASAADFGSPATVPEPGTLALMAIWWVALFAGRIGDA